MASQAPILRDYQASIAEAVRGAYRHRYAAPLIVAPTGSGKTVIFAYIAHHAALRGKRVLILAHRIELVDQISEALSAAGQSHGIIAAGYPYRAAHECYVASLQTYVRRLHIFAPDLIIIDEAHHALGRNTYGKIIAAYPAARRLGVTATPVRLSGEGLSGMFDTMVIGPTVQELIDRGYLSPPRVFAPPGIDTAGLHSRGGDYLTGELTARSDRPSITGDAFSHYLKHAEGKAALAFCCSVEHAEHVAALFRSGSVSALALHGGTDRGLRREAVADFRAGLIQVLTSCELFQEGFDVPQVECGIMLRPTQSLGLWLQQCGRILRPSPGKTSAIILDHAGNALKLGLPTEKQAWSLTATRETAVKGPRPRSVKVCPHCFAASYAGPAACPNCGQAYPIESRTVARVAGELEEITPAQILAAHEKREARRAQGQADYTRLVEIGRQRGYGAKAEGWARHVLAGREKKRAAH